MSPAREAALRAMALVRKGKFMSEAVDDAVRFDVVETFQVGKGTRGFNHFGASAEGLDGVLGVEEGV